MYLDYASTSIKRKKILENILDNIEEYDGNPSSMHAMGRNSLKNLEKSRKIIAESIGAKSKDIIFTSGASESNNLILSNFNDKSVKIISSKIEHKSVLEVLKNSKSQVILLDASADGQISLKEFYEKVDENVKLVSIMYVNNETGIIQPVKEIGSYLRDKNIWFHIDAVQAYGHLDFNVKELNCDSLSLSGHKIGGLNNFGILYTRHKLNSLILGGNQENGRRAGTSNVMGALSMAYSITGINSEREYILKLKEYFIEKIQKIDFEINGDIKKSVNHIVNIYFPFIKSDLLITKLDLKGIYISAGSACNAGTLEPSYVIENMYDKKRANNSVRFSFGFTNTFKQIDELANILHEIYIDRKR